MIARHKNEKRRLNIFATFVFWVNFFYGNFTATQILNESIHFNLCQLNHYTSVLIWITLFNFVMVTITMPINLVFGSLFLILSWSWSSSRCLTWNADIASIVTSNSTPTQCGIFVDNLRLRLTHYSLLMG